jgi:hypothetical protein
MATKVAAKTLRAMVERYEEALRSLLAEAEDNDRLFVHRLSADTLGPLTAIEMGRHDVHLEVRRVAANALHRFHPEIAVK